MKYIERRPRIAKTFEVKTISGSRVSAKMAGTESTAKTMSVISRKSSATKSGVASSAPPWRTKKLLALQLGRHGHEAPEQPRITTLLLRIDAPSPVRTSSCTPV